MPGEAVVRILRRRVTTLRWRAQSKPCSFFALNAGTMAIKRSGRKPHTNRSKPDDTSGSTAVPAVLFDLDGTLIDSNYQHVQAWHEALRTAGIVIPAWKIHRRIGMSGKIG